MMIELTREVPAYARLLTWVQGRPAAVPPLILETDGDRRRNREAKARRDALGKPTLRGRSDLLLHFANHPGRVFSRAHTAA